MTSYLPRCIQNLMAIKTLLKKPCRHSLFSMQLKVLDISQNFYGKSSKSNARFFAAKSLALYVLFFLQAKSRVETVENVLISVQCSIRKQFGWTEFVFAFFENLDWHTWIEYCLFCINHTPELFLGLIKVKTHKNWLTGDQWL